VHIKRVFALHCASRHAFDLLSLRHGFICWIGGCTALLALFWSVWSCVQENHVVFSDLSATTSLLSICQPIQLIYSFCMSSLIVLDLLWWSTVSEFLRPCYLVPFCLGYSISGHTLVLLQSGRAVLMRLLGVLGTRLFRCSARSFRVAPWTC
jgi:hypothetical protein